jgi:hypothetical protein
MSLGTPNWSPIINRGFHIPKCLAGSLEIHDGVQDGRQIYENYHMQSLTLFLTVKPTAYISFNHLYIRFVSNNAFNCVKMFLLSETEIMTTNVENLLIFKDVP